MLHLVQWDKTDIWLWQAWLKSSEAGETYVNSSTATDIGLCKIQSGQRSVQEKDGQLEMFHSMVSESLYVILINWIYSEYHWNGISSLVS